MKVIGTVDPRDRHRHQRHLQARPGDVQGHHGLQLRDAGNAPAGGSFLNAGLQDHPDRRASSTPVLEDGRREPCYRSEVMCYEGGIQSFVTYLGEKRKLEVLHPNVIYLKGRPGDGMAEIAMQYNDSYNELLLSFANNVHTRTAAPTKRASRPALTRVLNAYGRKRPAEGQATRTFPATTSARVSPRHLRQAAGGQFEGQTKAKLGNTEIRTLVSNIVYDQADGVLEETPAWPRPFWKRPHRPPARRAARRPASSSAARARWRPAGCPASWRLPRERPQPHRNLHRRG